MISRKLHDQVAQSIAAGLNGLTLSEHYQGTGDPERARTKRTEAETVIRYALDVTKELATLLRQKPGGARHRGTSPARTQQIPLTAPAELLLIIREALHNAMAHANATTITIHLSTDDGVVTASVMDNGVGLRESQADSQSSVGLQSIKERAALLGGMCRIGPGRDVGTEVLVRVPCSRQP
jgi:signal transduction histidine kinase